MKPSNEMHAAIVTYFTAEKRESLLFIVVGLAALAVSLLLWRAGSPYRGMGYPLVAIGLIQVVVGSSVYFRTDAQVLELHRRLASDPAAYAAAELPRMAAVRRNFKVYKTIEIALLALGTAGFFHLSNRQTLFAVALGLIVQSSLMLTLDLAAERRADVYLQQIRRLTAQQPA